METRIKIAAAIIIAAIVLLFGGIVVTIVTTWWGIAATIIIVAGMVYCRKADAIADFFMETASDLVCNWKNNFGVKPPEPSTDTAEA